MSEADGQVRTSVGLTRAEAEDLLFEEAGLLDRRCYPEWLALMADDVEYWIPSWRTEAHVVTDTDRDVSLLYYNRESLGDYVARAESGDAHVMDPPPRSDRLVTNVVVVDADAGEVRAKFSLHLHRRGKQDVFSGTFEYRLRRCDDGLRIVSKKVLLSNNSLERGYLPVV